MKNTLLIILSIFSIYSYNLAQSGANDFSFNIGAGFSDAAVKSIIVQTDGKIVVGGGFLYFNNIPKKYIVRLNSDGTIDDSFNNGGSGFSNLLSNQEVRTIAIQTDGKILVGGRFGAFNDVLKRYIVRLNVDGSIDNSFNIGTGFDGDVNSICLLPDGKIMVGGMFLSYNGLSTSKIIRLNSDGSRDNTFNTGSGFTYLNNNLSLNLYDLAIQTDGKILVGGKFDTYNGASKKMIIRLNQDGSSDDSFSIGLGFNEMVRKICIQQDGKILIGGWFYEYNGIANNRIVRLENNGSIDNTFNTNSANMSFNKIYAITTQADGKILIGGQGDLGLKRLNSDGSEDATFDVGYGLDGDALVIVKQNANKILVGGYFGSYSSLSTHRSRLVRIFGNCGIGFPNPIIYQNGNTLSTTGGPFISYQWMKNGLAVMVDGTSPSYTISSPGWYSVLVTNSEGCPNTSPDFYAQINAAGFSSIENKHISISPNPANNSFTVSGIPSGSKMILTDLSGKVSYMAIITEVETIVNTKQFEQGVYLLSIYFQGQKINSKIVIQH